MYHLARLSRAFCVAPAAERRRELPSRVRCRIRTASFDMRGLHKAEGTRRLHSARCFGFACVVDGFRGQAARRPLRIRLSFKIRPFSPLPPTSRASVGISRRCRALPSGRHRPALAPIAREQLPYQRPSVKTRVGVRYPELTGVRPQCLDLRLPGELAVV
jgi:hypothetical protein